MANSINSIINASPRTIVAWEEVRNFTQIECPDTYRVADAQKEEVASYLTTGGGKVFLGNAFSLQMVAPCAIITVEEAQPGEIPEGAVSIIGHADTAAVVSGILNREIACNRASISLGDGDVLYVAQLTGGRLPEGATRLPEGFTLTFRRVTVHC